MRGRMHKGKMGRRPMGRRPRAFQNGNPIYPQPHPYYQRFNRIQNQPRISQPINILPPVNPMHKKNVDISEKIEEINGKIEKEIERRKMLIRSLDYSNDRLFKETKTGFRIDSDFRNFLVKQSDKSILAKFNLRLKLRRLRFATSASEDDSYDVYMRKDSVLRTKAKDWQKIEKLVNIIKNNSSAFIQWKKQERLVDLSNDYNELTNVNHCDTYICPRCGSENEKKAKFCHYCGEILKTK